MKKQFLNYPLTFALATLLSVGFSGCLTANTLGTLTPIEEIVGNPVKFADKSVTIKGFVTQLNKKQHIIM